MEGVLRQALSFSRGVNRQHGGTYSQVKRVSGSNPDERTNQITHLNYRPHENIRH